jgi:hypothetical protein
LAARQSILSETERFAERGWVSKKKQVPRGIFLRGMSHAPALFRHVGMFTKGDTP